MIIGGVFFAALAIAAIWKAPKLAFGLGLLASLKWLPAGPLIWCVISAVYSLWRWPYMRHAACKGTGKNPGSTSVQWGHCSGDCRSGEIPIPGARLIRGMTGRSV